jgi:RecA/RadA recombinase
MSQEEYNLSREREEPLIAEEDAHEINVPTEEENELTQQKKAEGLKNLYKRTSLFNNISIAQQFPALYEQLQDKNTKCTTGGLLLFESASKEQIFTTGSDKIDDLFSCGGITNGEVVEIVGQTQSGKTTFVKNILIENMRYDKEAIAIYLDSKGDFQGNFLKMIKFKGIGEEEGNSIIERVFVRNFQSVQNLMDCLTFLTTSQLTSNLRFVVIDSIEGPFFVNPECLKMKLKLVSELHSLIYQLSKEFKVTVSYHSDTKFLYFTKKEKKF